MRRKLFLALSLILLAPSRASAVTVPSFPSCAAPQGTTVVSYNTGTHGIVGSSATYVGSDVVYRLSDDALTQCFCPSDSGNGIQTDWWKVTNQSEADIDLLTKQGWFYIPTGAVWGLDNSAYLARNTSYSCRAGSSTAPVPADSTGVGGGGEVLGLASTGNTPLLVAIFVTASLTFLTALARLIRGRDEKSY